MQDNIRTPLEKAVAGISRMIGSDIVAAGEGNISMAFLANSFSSAIYGFVEKVGTQGQLAILADPSLHGMPIEAHDNESRDIGSAIAHTACAALTQKMRPKMIEMCRHLHKDKILDTFASISTVLENAARENAAPFDHDQLRSAASFASSVAEAGLPSDYQEQLSILPEALKSIVDRRKDKAFIARMGEPLQRLVRLADRANDLVQLDNVDPSGFARSIDKEVVARRPSSLSMAA